MSVQQSMMHDDIIVGAVLARFPDTWAIYRFGSSGTPDEHTGSDVDVALLFAPGKRDLLALAGELSDVLHKTVDLVDLRSASTILQKEAVMTGRRISAPEAFEADMFEVRVMGDYQKLCQERREIVEDGLRSGSFYGR
jgi:predicted nucleotidyltransferase